MRTEQYCKIITAESPEKVYAVANPMIDANIPVDERFIIDPREQGLTATEANAVMETIDGWDGFWTPMIAPLIDGENFGERTIAKIALPPEGTHEKAVKRLSQTIINYMDQFSNRVVTSASVIKVDTSSSDEDKFAGTTSMDHIYHVEPIVPVKNPANFTKVFTDKEKAVKFASECAEKKVDVRLDVREKIVFHARDTDCFEAVLTAYEMTPESKPVQDKWWFIKKQCFWDDES